MNNTLDMMRRAKNAYHRKWQRENPEKVKAAQEKYWIKKAREIIENDEANKNNR